MAARSSKLNLAACAGRTSAQIGLGYPFIRFVVEDDLEISRYKTIVDLDEILSWTDGDLGRTDPIWR